MKPVAVEGMTLAYTAKMGETPMGNALVTAQPGLASQNVRVDGKGVYVDGADTAEALEAAQDAIESDLF